MSRWILCCSLLLACIVYGRTIDARVIYVDGNTGNDTQDGLAPNRAVATIQQGAKIVRGGDLMIVREGVYYETPVFDNLGSSANKPVWILAQPRGSVTISGMWKKAATGKVRWKSEGRGIYSAAHGPALFAGYQNMFLFRFMSLRDLRQATARTTEGEVKTPPYGFAVQNNRVYVRLPGDIDPNGKAIHFSTPSWGEGPLAEVVTMNNAPYVILDGFRIAGSGTRCIQVAKNSHHVTIRNTIFSYCRYGMRLPDHSLVEWSEYTYPGFHDFAEQIRLLNQNDVRRIFPLVKKYHLENWYEGAIADGYKDPTGNLELRYNFMHEAFDGERLGLFDNSVSHHNVYMYNYDNHIELEGWTGSQTAKNLRVHHSLFLAAASAPISHQHQAVKGPHYVYRNVIYGLDDHGWSAWAQIKSKAPKADAGIFYYHNLMWHGVGELFWNSQRRDMFRFRNNIFIFERNWNDEKGAFDSDYNLLINNRDKPWLYGNHGKYLGTDPAALRFIDVKKLNFGIQQGSPAQNAGVKLPGFNDQADGRPDIGPFEVDNPPASHWPRPRKTAFTSETPQGWNGPPPPSTKQVELVPPSDLRIINR